MTETSERVNSSYALVLQGPRQFETRSNIMSHVQQVNVDFFI